mgnify:CR=1 FL=1
MPHVLVMIVKIAIDYPTGPQCFKNIVIGFQWLRHMLHHF